VGIDLVDDAVAATVEVDRASLATLNVKRFPMFDGLAPPYRAHGAVLACSCCRLPG
jgi:predicted nucleic acid-binding protein